MNPHYGFWVQKASEETPWVITYLGRRAGVEEMRKQIQSRYLRYISPHDALPPCHLSELGRDKSFQWTAVQEIAVGGKQYVKASYRRQIDYPREAAPTPVEGHLVFDPANHWAITEGFAKLGIKKKRLPASELWRVAYADHPVGTVRPFRRVESILASAGGATTRTVFEVGHIQRRDVPESVFFLPAYGLPELGLAPPAPQGVSWPVLALLGTVFILAAASIRVRYAGRGGSPPPAPHGGRVTVS